LKWFGVRHPTSDVGHLFLFPALSAIVSLVFTIFLVHPVKAYVAWKKLKTMLTACLDQGVKYFVSRPLRRLRLSRRALEKREFNLSFLRVAVIKKGPSPQAGSLLFIYTGSVDMNIRFSSSCLAWRLKACFRPGVRYS
jgi:hypothetical protein